MSQTLRLIAKRDRRLLYFSLGTALAVIGLLYSKTLPPGLEQDVVATGCFTGIPISLAVTLFWVAYQCNMHLCLKGHIPGLSSEVFIYFRKGVKNEDRPVVRNVYDTPIYLSEPCKDLENLFPDAWPIFSIRIRHWLHWEERWKGAEQVVIYKGMPVISRDCFEVDLIPKETITLRTTEEGVKKYPLFEMGFSKADYPEALDAVDWYFDRKIKMQEAEKMGLSEEQIAMLGDMSIDQRAEIFQTLEAKLAQIDDEKNAAIAAKLSKEQQEEPSAQG